MPITYSFITRWKAHAPLTDVWAQIKDPLSWPQWWPDFESVEEIAPGRPDGTGNTISCTVKSPVGYRLRFCITAEQIIEQNLISGRASGDLEGTGTWLLQQHPDHTYIEIRWNVYTTITWMNTLAFLLRPIFIYNHTKIMERGATALAKRLNTTVTVI